MLRFVDLTVLKRCPRAHRVWGFERDRARDPESSLCLAARRNLELFVVMFSPGMFKLDVQ